MKKAFTFIFLFSLLLITFPKVTTAQDNIETSTPQWVKMMKDPSVNFYDVQEAFNNFFSIHDNGKGSGWKQFKRWEWFMEPRVFPTGKRIPHAQVWNEMQKFNSRYTDPEITDRSNWEAMGPFTSAEVTGHWNPGIGRINVIARHPDDANTIYIGAPSGGCWKTTDEGENWTPLTDDLPVLGVSAIAINPDNPDVVYIGTGDNDHNDNYSIGVLKSTNAGQDWEVTGLDWSIYSWRTISKLLINPDDTAIVYAASSDGLYKTTNSGQDWTKILNGDIDDIEFKPGDPNTIYAVTQRFFKSTDAGASFEETTGVPNTSRVQIAVTNDNPEYVYYFSSRNGIYRSENSGESFTKRSNQPNPGYQDWYDLAMDVSDVDGEEIHIGEINTYRSLNGGQSWVQTTDWTWGNNLGYTHCDIHEIVFFGGDLYIGSDGMICKSTDNGDNFTNLTEGMCIRQFYRIGVSKTDPYKILGGSQDNGTSVYTDNYWHEWLGADGMECVVDYTNSDIVYGTSQNGHFYKSDEGGNFGNVSISQPGGGAWVTPFVIHPAHNQTLFAGTDEVKKTTNGMMSWTTISSLPGGDVKAMAVSESNPDYIYVSKNEDLYRTKDGGQTWDDLTGSYPYLYITYIAVHPSDPEKVTISFSGYTEGEKLYLSDNAGDSWNNISYNLPNIPANCVTFYDDISDPLYVGLDVGVYYLDNSMDEWTSFMNGLPNVIVNELEINYENNKIRAATYGRGLWESDIMMSAPVSDFEADMTLIPEGCAIDFTSLASGPPESFEWTFEGGVPESSTEQNPTDIVYNETGFYDVTLVVTNALGVDTLTKTEYIEVNDEILPVADFMADQTSICTNTVVHFTDLSEYCPSSWEWTFEPDNVTFMNGTDMYSQNPEVLFDEGVYNVSLKAVNSNGSHTTTKEEYISSGGSAIPFSEDFEFFSLNEKGWIIENPDGERTWELTDVFNPGNGDSAMYINNFNYQTIDARDRLVSPIMSFKGYEEVFLTFKHAYAQRYSMKDSLIIYISADCGENWERIWAMGPDGNGIFATSESTSEHFEPETIEEWCGSGYGADCFLIPLHDYDDMANIQIAFESFTNYGNNLYLDDILVDFYFNVNKSTEAEKLFNIYPNPANERLSVESISDVLPEKISISDIQGRKISKIFFDDNSKKTNCDLTKYEKGIYVLKIDYSGGSYVQKLIIQ